MARLRIGSRGSQLALWQANHISDQLRNQGHIAEIAIIKTTGDKITDVALSKVGTKGMFTKEIEEARAKEHPPEEAAAAAAAKTFRMTCSEPERETEKVEKLYEAFLQAKLQAGEHTGKLSRSSFNDFVLKKTRELQKQKNCKDVEYVVETVAGQVKLKALVKS